MKVQMTNSMTDEGIIPMRALLAGARRKEGEVIALTRRLVQVESPSDDKDAVSECAALATAHAKVLGGRVKLHKQREYGDVVEARFGPKAKAHKADRILLLGHLDTVLGRSGQSRRCRAK